MTVSSQITGIRSLAQHFSDICEKPEALSLLASAPTAFCWSMRTQKTRRTADHSERGVVGAGGILWKM